MASDDGTYYYDELVREDATGAIGAMAQVLETKSLVLYKHQCTQMILDFTYVRAVLGERKEIRTSGKFSGILKELCRQTFAANAVLKSCCCCVNAPPRVLQDRNTVAYSWLQVAVTQNDEAVFKVIRDDLKWCLRLVSILITELDDDPILITELGDEKRKALVEADKSDLKQKLDEFVESGAGILVREERSRDIELAKFLLARLNGKHVATPIESDHVWSQRQSINDLGHTGTSTVTAIDWFGVKLARKTFQNQQAVGDFLVERGIMRPLNHPNVVRFITCDQEEVPAILMESVEGNLLKYLTQRAQEYAAQPSGWVGRAVTSNAGSNILEVVDMMYQIALALEYLHAQGVAHCDIKPSNVLFNPCKVPGFEGYVQLKVCDFGVSKSGLNEDCLRDSSKTNRGTTIYRAPELRGRAKSVDLKKADLYSYALTCWHILHGEVPFANIERAALHQELLRGYRPDIEREIPDALAVLIRRCWSTNPQDRPPFSEVCLDLLSCKQDLLLQVMIMPPTLISVPENTAIRRWEVFQRSYEAVKVLIGRCLRSQRSSNAGQDGGLTLPLGDRTWRFGSRGCFSWRDSRQECEFVYPGSPE